MKRDKDKLLQQGRIGIIGGMIFFVLFLFSFWIFFTTRLSLTEGVFVWLFKIFFLLSIIFFIFGINRRMKAKEVR